MKKLDLLELEFEMDVILNDYLSTIKGGGGEGPGDDWLNFGGYGNPMHPIELDTVSISPSKPGFTDHVLYQALSWADASIGLSFSASEASAVYMGTAMPGWFSAASEGMAWVGVLDNASQFIDHPNWQDAAQMMIGATLIVVAGPELMLIGSAGLFIWEIIE
ncbi:hypothetical protein [Pedobacter agri]|uniref:Uncharacterized protein n=1 Tax=Pedobacter agri TaxID=454586 RepID=A0A9X3I9E9_9SPHI|nr:hypothetical protein [Pedobacter agri]MCX3264929.1 hypothetical protein [Pedobacter agri]